MRGDSSKQLPMYFAINVEAELPSNHPLRAIKRRANAILCSMNRDFEAAYSRIGRPGIAPERLLKALLLQALYSIRSEIQLMQAIQFNLLFRWFVDLSDDPVWTPETFSMNRERFEEHDLVRKFFDRIVSEAVIERYRHLLALKMKPLAGHGRKKTATAALRETTYGTETETIP